MSRHGARALAVGIAGALLFSLVATPASSAPATRGAALTRTVETALPAAADAGDFDPGNIISDAVFFDGYALSAAQVQTFISGKGASCVAGEQPCLKDYVTTTVAKPSDGLCTGYQGGLNQTAAQLIAGVAASCGISPKVLLVLLEKEQSLVSRSRPTTRAYQAATGFGCPDTAPCNAQYYGLFNQVYLAARQYQRYAASPASYNHVAGRTNNILFHPNASCGASPVFIQNQATAGLYNYTPYQPNARSLSNLYGTGDACSSYGNRNFWRIFSDWFGSPQASSALMRTPENGTVYLVSGSTKHSIASLELLGAYSPVGPVSFVSQAYLDRLTTGGPLGRTIVDPSGTVYFVDAGIKLPFGSCALVADYGSSCASLVSVTAEIAATLHTGPGMTRHYRTTTGKAFYVQGGAKLEVADDTALAAAGLPAASVTLLESGIAHLPYGAPITRPGTTVRDRSTGASFVVSALGLHSTPGAFVAQTAFATLPASSLDTASINRAPKADTVSAFVRDENFSVYLLTGDGKIWVRSLGISAAVVPVVPSTVLAAFPDRGSLGSPMFIKASDSVKVFAVVNGVRRPVLSWADLVALSSGNPAPVVHQVPPAVVATLPVGEAQLAPGSLAVAAGDGTVFLIDGLASKIPLSSFSAVAELGLDRLVTVPAGALSQLPTAPTFGTSAVQCGTERLLGLGGRAYALTSAQQTQYGVATFRSLDPLTCTSLTRSATPLGSFLLDPTGTIFLVESGLKRPIQSWGTYLALGGGTPGSTVTVSAYAAAMFPTGTPR